MRRIRRRKTRPRATRRHKLPHSYPIIGSLNCQPMPAVSEMFACRGLSFAQSARVNFFLTIEDFPCILLILPNMIRHRLRPSRPLCRRPTSRKIATSWPD